MRFQLLDIDVSKPLEAELDASANGLGILVRFADRPIDFVLHRFANRPIRTTNELADLLTQRSGATIVLAALQHTQAGSTERSSAPSLRTATVAICTKDRSSLLDRTLESLTQHVRVPAVSAAADVDILVVDNRSSDERTRLVVEKYPAVRYVYEGLAGLDFARNTALREASGDLLIYLDDDAVVDHNWLPGLLESWQRHPDAAGFTGQVLPLELETEAQVLFELNGGFRRGFEEKRFEPSMQSDPLFPGGAGVFGTGTNMAFRRDALMALGGFDEALDTGAPLPGGGDHDIFYRVIRSGGVIVYVPTYLVFHEHRRDLAALKRQYYSWGTGVMAFLSKSIETDREVRRNLRAVRRWWFKDRLRQVRRAVRNHHPLPLHMLLAEIRGGIVGLFGEYRRSRKRIAKIREAVDG